MAPSSSTSSLLEADYGLSQLLSGNGNGNGIDGNSYSDAFASFFNNSNNNGNGNVSDFFGEGSSSTATATVTAASSSNSNNHNASSAAWQKKVLFDQQQSQQQQQFQEQQNSLNQLLANSQQNSIGNANTNGNGNTTNGQFAFPNSLPGLDDLDILAASTAQNQSQNQQQQQQQNSQLQQMFVATLVDPNQGEEAPAQQMLFLPGSNQVIPMPNSNGGLNPMMALANMPVAFNQSQSQQQQQQTQNQASQDSSNNNNINASAWFDLNGNFKELQQWSNVNSHSAQNSQQQQGGLLNFHSLSGNGNNLDFSSFLVNNDDNNNRNANEQQIQLQQPPMNGAASANTVTSSTAPTPAEDKASMPVRPLSAYNFFFSDERERILTGKENDDDVYDSSKKQRLLLQHLAKDRSKRRPHRKTHGKINFTTLSKLIGQRWKQLPDERKNFYREVAAIDLERYQRELRERSPA